MCAAVLPGSQAAPTDAAKAAANSGPPTRGQGFRDFLKKLIADSRHSPLTVLIEALSFVDRIGVNMETLTDYPPIFYRVYDDELIFVWPSGLTLSFRLIEAKHEAVIMIFFDHLARSEVFE